jgi:histone H3/H4
MSTGKKPRAVKPKAAKKEVEPAPAAVPAPVAAPVPVAAPAPEPAAVPETPAVVTPPPPPPTIITSTSRVTTNINTMGVNALSKARRGDLDTKIEAFKYAKAALAAGKVSDSREVEKTENGATVKVKESYDRNITAEEKASFTKTVATYEHSILSMEADSHAYSQDCLRFAKNAAPAIAVVIDETVKQLVTHAMQVGEAKGRKNIDLDHLYTPGLEKLSLAPLVLSLPTAVEVRNRLDREQREHNEKVAKEVLLKNQEKELKRRYHITKKDVAAADAKEAAAVPVAAAPAAAEPEPEEVDPEEHLPVDRKTSFDHYVREICKVVSTHSFAGKKLRVSGDMRTHVATLMKELLRRIAPMLSEAVRYDKSKTVQVDTVLFVLKLLLIDGHAAVETVELKNVDIPNPDALKVEQDKKAAEKKAGRKYVIDMSKIPNVIGRQAVHTVTYPTSGYADLEATIKRKLAQVEAEEAAKKPAEVAK